MDDFSIVPLSQRPELADCCAAWSYGEWGSQEDDRSLEETLARYKARIYNVKSLPLLWLGLSERNKPMGMAGLKETEHPDIPETGPWLASIYVHPKYRGQGVATKLIEFVVAEAKEKLGMKALYLSSADNASDALYIKLGWKIIVGKVRDLSGLDPDGKFLMRRDL